MNNRQRFYATMHYQPRDRSPIADFGFWEETILLWHEQGLPEEIYFDGSDNNTAAFFGMDFCIDSLGTGVEVGLFPEFEEKIIEDHGNRIILQQADGVIVVRDRFMSSIPKPIAHTLVDRDSWDTFFVPRLDPENPLRFPIDWKDRIKRWENREEVLILPGGSLYGWLRNWMGMEELSYTVYDDPVFFETMISTVAECILGMLEKILESGIHFDACGLWEDMAYNAGPLLSPRHFKRYLVPHYRRIADLCRKFGVDVIWLDCDGKIDALLPLWLDAGINCMFPVEIGTWGADPVKFRQEYGKDLLMMGGFDKHILSRSQDDITREVYRLAPLVEEGGFIGFCDHRVPPDVPYENYLFYLETVRKVWGKDLNLPPMSGLH